MNKAQQTALPDVTTLENQCGQSEDTTVSLACSGGGAQEPEHSNHQDQLASALTIVIEFDETNPLELYGCEQFFVANIPAGHNQKLPEIIGKELHVKHDDLENFNKLIEKFYAGKVDQLIIYLENDFQDKLPPIVQISSLLQFFSKLTRLSIWIDPGFDCLKERFFKPLCETINSLCELSRFEFNFRNGGLNLEVSHHFMLHPTVARLQWLTIGCLNDNQTELLEYSDPNGLHHLSVCLDEEKFAMLHSWVLDKPKKVQQITELAIKLDCEVDDFELKELVDGFPNLQSFRFQKNKGKPCGHDISYLFNKTDKIPVHPNLIELTLIGVEMICQHNSNFFAPSITKLTIAMSANVEFFSDDHALSCKQPESTEHCSYPQFWGHTFSQFPSLKEIILVGHCREPMRNKYWLESYLRRFVASYGLPEPKLRIFFALYKKELFDTCF